MFDHTLNNDLWYNILLRLPIKTLVICACTSKTFNSYITSPDFMAAHFKKSKDTPFFLLRTENHKEELFGLYPDDESLNLNWDSDMLTKFPFKSRNTYFHIVGSCNGVVCLSDDLIRYTDVIYLWNPSLNKHIQLPEPNVTFRTHGIYDHCLGFGFDELANDFKVVRVAYVDVYGPLVEVYSVKSGSWRYLENCRPMLMIYHFHYTQCFSNGAIHWLARDRSAIVTFNLVDEGFGVMKLPVSLDCSNSYTGNLIVRNCWDMLAMIHLRSKNSSTSQQYDDICIWVMKEYGVADSWTPMFTLTYPNMGPIIRMVAFRKNKDILMLIHKNDTLLFKLSHEIHSVNRNRGTDEKLGTCSWSPGLYLDVYEQSLALFNEGKPTLCNISKDDDNVAGKDAGNSDVTSDDVEDNNSEAEELGSR